MTKEPGEGQKTDLGATAVEAGAPSESTGAETHAQLAAQVERVRNDEDFIRRVRTIIARDHELLDRLAE